MKIKFFVQNSVCVIVLLCVLAACSPTGDAAGQLAGKWVAHYVQTDGYGTKLDMRVELDMKRSGQCEQRTYSVLTEKLYQKRACSYVVGNDNHVWITYEDGQKLRTGLEGDRLMLYQWRPGAMNLGPHLGFDRK